MRPSGLKFIEIITASYGKRRDLIFWQLFRLSTNPVFSLEDYFMHSVPEPLWCFGAQGGLSFIGTSPFRDLGFSLFFLSAKLHATLIPTLNFGEFYWYLICGMSFPFLFFPMSLSVLNNSLTIVVMFQEGVKISLCVVPFSWRSGPKYQAGYFVYS